MKTRALVSIRSKEEYALFETFRASERIFFVLDHGDDPPQSRMLYHPDERFLTLVKQEEFDYRYEGAPIAIENYLELPPHRIGFVPYH